MVEKRMRGAAGWTVVIAVAMLAPPVRAQGTLSALQTDMDLIARRARPAVVTVYAQRHVGKKGAPAVQRRLRTRVGSGVAVEESSILTTASVVMGADRVVVRTVNGIQTEAVVAGIDPISNLALLRVAALRLPAVPFGSPRDAQVGSWVISLGTSYRAQPTQSVGNVAYRYREPHQSLLQLTNTVYPGNSGAAALNTRGELVGIVQGELTPPEPLDRDPEGERRPGNASFILPVETVRPVFESLRRQGRVPHGFLGVSTRAVSVGGPETQGRRTPIGAEVRSVVPGGPAERLGLRPGDLIVAYERERIEYPEQLARWVAASAPGLSVELVWVRDETAHNGRVVLSESPSTIPQWVAGDFESPESQPPLRITELEREIRRLSEELSRLKDRAPR